MNDSMAKLHFVDPTEIGLESFVNSNHVGRQVSRCRNSIDSETETIESMNNLIEWLPNNLPTEKKLALFMVITV